MICLDRTLASVFAPLLALALAACSDDGLAPADTDVPASTSGQTADTGPAGGSTDAADSGTGLTGPADDTTSGFETGDSGESGGTGTPANVCEAPDQCVLINDCCQCAAAHVDDVIPECPMDCLQPTCDAMGLFDVQVTCVDGSCELGPFNCSPEEIVCDSIPPRCPPGTLPGVTPDGDCWTNGCVPVEACDSVPSCEACGDGMACIELATQAGPVYQCQAIPDDCGGVPTCACMPDACTAPYDVCSELDGAIECSCLDC